MANQQQQHRGQQQPAPAAVMEIAPIATSNEIAPLVPSTIEGAMSLAQWLAKSQFLPEKLKGKEADVFFLITSGMELGLPPLAALRGLYIVNGRVALEGKTKAALALARGAAEYIKRVEYTPQATTWETKRKGADRPVQMRFTLEEAKAAGLTAKEGPWRNYSQRMISWRALGWLVDDVYPDIVMGVATAEDFDSSDDGFRPIGDGVDLWVPPGTEQGGTTTIAPPGPAAKQAGASPLDPKKPPAPPPKTLITEEEVATHIAEMKRKNDEKSLKAYAAKEINDRCDGSIRDRLLSAYQEQLELIRVAAKDDEKQGG